MAVAVREASSAGIVMVRRAFPALLVEWIAIGVIPGVFRAGALIEAASGD
jgi:hypothetical protein